MDDLDDLSSFDVLDVKPNQSQQEVEDILLMDHTTSPPPPDLKRDNHDDLVMNDDNDLLAGEGGPLSYDAGDPSSMLLDMNVHNTSGQTHSTINSVHMHIQENAKIPLLNQAVDRSNNNNSTSGSRMRASSTSAGPTSEFSSMAELFLSSESGIRQSLNQNYESLGALLLDDTFPTSNAAITAAGSAVGGEVPPDPESITLAGRKTSADMEIDELTAAINPTPWSEIEKKSYKTEGGVAVAGTTGNNSTPYPPQQHPHQYNHCYPHGRQHPLPIPENIPSPQPTQPIHPMSAQTPTTARGETFAQHAVATAAAIAASETGPQSFPPPSPGPASPSTIMVIPPPGPATGSNGAIGPPGIHPHPLHHSGPLPYTKAQLSTPLQGKKSTVRSSSSTTASSKATNGNAPLQRPTHAIYSPPQHSRAHVANRASVLAAANRKSQYGFGGNHTVPSVPAPPTKRSPLNKHPPVIPPTLPRLGVASGSHLHHQQTAMIANYSGAAYERKKQRAKNSRIKFNEAIESLSIAMSLAGTQSRQRTEALRTNAAGTSCREMTLQTCDECVTLTEQAKKWDRPSFVGAAAAVIQSLNSQCESLVRELAEFQNMSNISSTTNITLAPPAAATAEAQPPTDQSNAGGRDEILDPKQTGDKHEQTSHPNHKRHNPPSLATDNGSSILQHDAKRIRVKEEDSKGPIRSNQEPSRLVEDSPSSAINEIVFGRTCFMLDPISLARCACVSRQWNDLVGFSDNKYWQKLAIQRFGYYNVRQWTETVQSDDSANVSQKELYKRMSDANVMPHFAQEGCVFLGGAKIKGRISGWVYMVERSNGETTRCVQREGSQSSYHSRPVVEMRIVLQNTGLASRSAIVRRQEIAVDVSTRRRGGEMKEISWDQRLSKVVKNLDGSIRQLADSSEGTYGAQDELCRLSLFETAMLVVQIDAKGCSTTTKFQQRSNFTQVLVCLDGTTTVPLVIPVLREVAHEAR